ncbi:MAG: transcription termination/antitermination protein NusA [Acidobacteria bacterium]|nr:MAG: transcription termination/antitermination protein NusA [Acidobacteriota bacterium]PYS81126.1 MAG: transcription termination/antitermination protein NusA [Acidobacteriota bacterium]
MSASIGQSIDAVCKEKGIDRDVVIEAVKEAVRAAARKQFKSGEEIQVDWSPDSGLEIFASKVIVEEVTNPGRELSLDEARELAGDEVDIGDELQLPLPVEDMGRIAAQTAKQILFQKVRDAERANIYEQYIDKVGDLVNGYIKRFERGDIIVDLGTVEALLPRNQQSRGETWNQGERIRVVIDDVSKESKGPQVIVSRTSPEILKRLFEMEVPEIYDGTVVIKSAVREPGERAKIAVASTERDVDPVGACVGMKGSRVQAIIRELRGEKIDIIEWSDEPSVFAANALSPAKVNQVRITDIEHRQMEVIVNEDQLSLAIGKRGQNVRLATKLVGWNIDIRSEEELKREVAAQMGAMIASGEAVPLERLEGMNPAMVATLAEHGVGDIESLANATVDDIADFLDVSIDQAEALIGAAQVVVESARVAAEGEEVEEAGAQTEERPEEAQAAEAATTEAPATEETEAAQGEAAEATAGPEVEMAEESEERRTVEQHAASFEADPNAEAREVEPSGAMTADGYDEAVETRPPFMAEDLSPDNLLAKDAAEPVAATEVEQMSADELLLQGAGRDLRPDTITPAPDIFSAEAAVIQNRGVYAEEERPSTLDVETDGIGGPTVREVEEDSSVSPVADLGGEASAPEVQVSSAPTPAGEAGPTTVENVAEDEADDASGNVE